MRRTARMAIVAGVLLTISVGNRVGAQDASPVAITPGVVPASECTAAPLPIDFLGILVTTPVPDEPYTPLTSVPAGTAPDAQTQAEITAAVRQFVACSNSGDVLRGLALLDDAYLRRALDPQGALDPETANSLVESIATPYAMSDDQLIALLAIHEMVQTPDGTVAVVVETDGGINNPDGTDVDLLIFKQIDGRWLIVDAVSDIDDVEAANTPTPTS